MVFLVLFPPPTRARAAGSYARVPQTDPRSCVRLLETRCTLRSRCVGASRLRRSGFGTSCSRPRPSARPRQRVARRAARAPLSLHPLAARGQSLAPLPEDARAKGLSLSLSLSSVARARAHARGRRSTRCARVRSLLSQACFLSAKALPLSRKRSSSSTRTTRVV